MREGRDVGVQVAELAHRGWRLRRFGAAFARRHVDLYGMGGTLSMRMLRALAHLDLEG